MSGSAITEIEGATKTRIKRTAIRTLFGLLMVGPSSKKSKFYKLFYTRNEKISLTEYEKS
jgi:hypothetical protein